MNVYYLGSEIHSDFHPASLVIVPTIQTSKNRRGPPKRTQSSSNCYPAPKITTVAPGDPTVLSIYLIDQPT